MANVAIRVENLSKLYRIGGPQARYKTLRESLVGAARAPIRRAGRLLRGEAATDHQETIWALKDVSFEVKHGEVLGIIGRNGAGKSTLLKILSRITAPTEGSVDLYGRVGSLLEVGTGFHPELTGRENIYLNGAILGMKRNEIERKFDEIVAFAELEKFLDTPVKHYSSGMYVRLAFAVAAHLDPEILLVDEVLAVGDAAFQKKCLGKMGEVAGEGRTVLFVSHNMAAVENLCSCGIVLHDGKLRFSGQQTEAVFEYLRGTEPTVCSLRDREDRLGSGDLRIVDIQLLDPDGQEVSTVCSGLSVDIHLRYEATHPFGPRQVIASIQCSTLQGIPVFLHHNRLSGQRLGPLSGHGTFVLHLRRLPLPPSTYRIGYSIIAGGDYLDGIRDALEFSVADGDYYGSGEVPPISHGVCLVDGEWEYRPADAPGVVGL